MMRQSVSLFGIASIAEYLRFCAEAVEEFSGDQADVLRRFAAILALNHIPDWLQYKLSADERERLSLSYCTPGRAVIDDFEALNPDLQLVRQIANGFKHVRPVHSTERVAGYGAGPYGVGPYGSPYLPIDLGEDVPASGRYQVGYDLCRRALGWWQQQLKDIVGENENVGAPA